MQNTIKELRERTGMTQKAFAELYGVPLSTLRKWEQGEASPPQYVINLIARTLPSTDSSLKTFYGENGSTYYYDKLKKTVADTNLFTNDFVDSFGEITINRDHMIDLRKETKFNCATSQGELQKNGVLTKMDDVT